MFQNYPTDMARFLMVLGCFVLLSGVVAQNPIKSPADFFPHRPGEQFTRHDQVCQYFQYLAGKAPQTMKLQQYGWTYEDRPLQIAIFSSAENMQRLEEIRQNNLRLAGMLKGKPDLTHPVAIVWISMGVHGNEPSGTEGSMELAYRLATQTESHVEKWLKNVVVILDPSLNPDGHSRYVNWFRSVSHRIPNANLLSREHHENWGTGRNNHYYFDLNRDWAWATQIETRQRLEIYHQWLPQIHADVHEQELDNPYYFAPAAEPMHDFVTNFQRNYQAEVGKNHARYFDANDWAYFTGEVFDLFYPSYGDTYPTFNGAIGMTYEQAGHSRAGRSVKLTNGDTLRLNDRVLHHLTTCLSTLEMASRDAADLVRNFHQYFQKSAHQPPGKYLTYVVRASNPPNKVNDFCRLLDRHHIEYGLAATLHRNVRAYDYAKNQEILTDIRPNDLIISALQPHGVLLQVLLDPEARLSDSLTYDITAWSLGHAYHLDMLALTQKISPEWQRTPYQSPEVHGQVHPVAWAFRRGSLAEIRLLSKLLHQNIQVRYATQAFENQQISLEAGFYVILRSDNFDIKSSLDHRVRQLASQENVEIFPILSGLTHKGRDLGSNSYKLIKKPEIAIVYGDEIEENSYGYLWHFFERDLEYPFTAIQLQQLDFMTLSHFNLMILPSGRLHLDEEKIKLIESWLQRGGRLIAIENALNSLTGSDIFEIEKKSNNKTEQSSEHTPYHQTERKELMDKTPGAIVRAKLDVSHPLTFGLGDHYFSMKTSENCFHLLKQGHNLAFLEEKYYSSGFIGSKLRHQLEKTLIVGVQRVGRGEVVYFVDQPLFRAYWYQGKLLFFNSLVF